MSRAADAAASARVLIDAGELRARQLAGTPPVLLDVRWKLGERDGERHYRESHIPGAVFVDLETELSGPPSPAHGRHPLPSLDALERAARRWGVNTDSQVVAYDDDRNLAAARAWWLLRWAGLEQVSLLDGGLAAWRRAGFPLERGVHRPRVGDAVLTGGALPVLDADDAERVAGQGVLLDARAAERYRGELEPIDPRAGHIAGARSAPTVENLRADGTFAAPSQLRARFRALGVERASAVGVYCGSGVTAAHELAALAIAGLDGALYPGSWSQWSSDPRRAVATGAEAA